MKGASRSLMLRNRLHLKNCLPFIFMLLGCGTDKDGMGISGLVSYQGQLVQKGTIVFRNDNDGKGIRAPIKTGRYEISEEAELKAGNYRVEIHASEETGRMISDNDIPGQMMAETRDLIPPQYNFDSGIIRRVDNTTTELNFNLE